MRTTKKK